MCLFTCGSSNQTRPQHQGPNNLTPQNRNSSKIGILQLTSINQIQTQIPESKTTEQKYQTDSPTSRRPSITHSSSENGRKFTQQKNHSDETKIPNSSDEENIKIRVVRPISTKFQTQKPQQYSEQQRPFSIKLNTPYLHEETKETESKDTDSIHLDFSDIASGFDKETYESIKRNRESLINKIREFQQNLEYDNLKLLINYLLDDLISAKATKTSKKISHEERQYTTYIIETIKTEPNNRTTTLGNYDVLYRWIQDNDLYKKLLEHFKFPREIKDEISQELQQLNLEDQFAGKVMTLLFFTSNKSPKILNIMSKTTEE